MKIQIKDDRINDEYLREARLELYNILNGDNNTIESTKQNTQDTKDIEVFNINSIKENNLESFSDLLKMVGGR